MQRYAVIVGLLGFFVDFLLILGTNRLTFHRQSWIRAGMAAAVGGIHAGMCLIPEFLFLGSNLWRFVFLGLVAGLAFGFDENPLRQITVFLLLHFALSGAASAAGNRGIGSILLAVAVIGLLSLCGLTANRGGREFIPVELRYGERKWNLTALRDSGNLLRDPITGEQVLIAGADVGEQLLGLTAHQLARPTETLLAGKAPGMRLIPYKTIGQSGAMLLAMRLRDVRIGSWKGNAMVAFAPEQLGGDTYQMLIGGMLS